ncbi:MAG: hypothetical protein HKN21_05440 [Candidatus Eisenbacteria bacterium]|uniref:DUF7133 domain-containing protein n=1 Tax=Eiseniibacteriota bacterium TaxID=2212470 RepID=A0A7Y2H1M2_UNCEI|nr:hypothetical protein [Candidatus Eisenbacteria bacterium]
MKHLALRLLICGGIFLGLAPMQSQAAIETIPGYYAFEYATDMPFPTSIAFSPDSTLYVATRFGEIYCLPDTNGDGFADTTIVFDSGYPLPLGIAFWGNDLYVSSSEPDSGIITKHVDLDGDHQADVRDTLVTGLPIGDHRNNGITFDAAGDLYVAVGSFTSEGVQPPLSSRILRYTNTGTFVEVMGEGFRNPYDLVFTSTGRLYAPDNGPTGDANFTCYEAPDELNLLFSFRNYGYPDCFGVGDCVDLTGMCAQPPCGVGECERNNGCEGTQPPAVFFDPHAGVTGITTGDGFRGFGSDYLFVAEFGQTVFVPNCLTSFGHRISFVALTFLGLPSANPGPFEFATGFGNPIDLTVGPDSSLYVADYGTGIIHRIIQTQPGGVGDDLANDPGILKPGPNPTRGPLKLQWEPTQGEAYLDIFDVAGRLIRSESFDQSMSRWVWDLRDRSGKRVTSGLYLARWRSSTHISRQKFLILD